LQVLLDQITIVSKEKKARTWQILLAIALLILLYGAKQFVHDLVYLRFMQ